MEKNKKLKFIIPSIIGVLLFLFPIPSEDGFTLAVAVLCTMTNNLLQPIIKPIIYFVMISSGIMATITRLFQPKFIIENVKLKSLFDVSVFWTVARALGAIIAAMCAFKVGPDLIIGEDTGLFMVDGLLVYWAGTILVAGTFMDLLLNYGLMEFVGTYVSRFMRPCFKIPGRSAVDCVASWVGDALIGILITTDQYQTGYYSKREAATIATTFSAVSISFTMLVVVQLDLLRLFLPFFLTGVVTGIVCGMIMPRLWPLSSVPDVYVDGGPAVIEEEVRGNTFKRAVDAAVARSEKADINPLLFIKKGITTAIEVMYMCLPVTLLVGTISLILSYRTDVFLLLGAPFRPVLELMNVPEAVEVSKCVLAGFGDMFIPSVLASSSITSEFSRFLVGVLSITQLIYMSEVGSLLLSSKLPIRLRDLVVIFLERTVISIPVIYIVARVFVF